MKHRTKHEFLHILSSNNKHCLIIFYVEQDDRSAHVNNFFGNLVSWNYVMMRAEAFVILGEPKVPVA
jgi:hypothetical protein